MKHFKIYTVIVILLLFATGCEDSSTSGLSTTCGDGELNGDEICDGSYFKEGAKVCPNGLILKDESAFSCTETCGLDFSQACAAPTCGDGELTAGEVCDQDKFREGVKVCPTGMEEVDNPNWGCTQTCLLDISKACKVPENTGLTTTCGDGELNDNEICDGSDFKEGVKVCPDGLFLKDETAFNCTETCELDFSQACVAPTLYISEIRMMDNTEHNAMNHLYIEIGNIGEETPLSDCKLVGVKLSSTNTTKIDTNFVFEQPLSAAADKLGSSISDTKNVIGICYEPTAGWLQTQYDDKTLTLDECDAYDRGIGAAKLKCDNVCSDRDANAQIDEAGVRFCFKACQDAADEAYSINEINKDKAYNKLIHESCDFYIPSTNESLKMRLDDWRQTAAGTESGTYHTTNGLWGIGVMCGNIMHDMIKLDGMNFIGGARMCVPSNKLENIITTGDTVHEGSYQGNVDAESYQLSNGLDDRTSQSYHEAKCGEVNIT